MGLYWTGNLTRGYSWKGSAPEVRRRDLDTLARRLKRAYWWGAYGRAWRYVELAAWSVIALSLIVLAAVTVLP